MKKLFLSLSLLLSVLFSSAQFSEVTDIDDLALIYIGSQHRNDWTKELFRPYVVHEYSNGTKSWNFDGFLMIEFMKYNSSGVDVSFGEYNGAAASKEDWEDLLNTQLGVTNSAGKVDDSKPYGCRALDELIGELIPILGEPGHKHKVVFSIPLPIGASMTWGKLNGFSLSFGSYNDKLTAMKWYCDQVIEKFNSMNFKHIELDGMYWTKEAFPDDAANVRTLVKDMNKYYNSKGLLSYWIPYSTAPGRDVWAECGVDVCYIQPNYYFKATTPIEKLQGVIDEAWEYEAGLEMEFEGRNFTYNTATGKRTSYWPENAGMYARSTVFYQRLVDYIDYFESNDVFEFMPIAYYSGFQAVYDYMTSGNKKDKEIMDRLSTIMNRRHQISGFDKAPAGINDITVDDNLNIYAVPGGIYICDEAAATARIYSLDGRLVSAPVSERLQYGNVHSCAPGIYIVAAGSKSLKVCVK